MMTAGEGRGPRKERSHTVVAVILCLGMNLEQIERERDLSEYYMCVERESGHLCVTLRKRSGRNQASRKRMHKWKYKMRKNEGTGRVCE